ncbi:LysR family transcriptional regulator [Stappia taiwanensis]|uniref:LysR family transcriptional regulator n=1 Tax=Stappia taiwanensis TaxID=992267 RepID=A0A838XXU2_9HYPH|nr:LysR family transcriptional regulator [Stappia taiwanensis]MBA4611713.1 LysR family transcriptional regulator [Stappia taiwanensis]GGE97381.1 LysR family transcriptional regulator [Stappia taiwanensis]
MTLEQLRIFVAVAEREHVTRAAEALNLTQSTISAAVSALEARHDVALFDRVGRGIRLTEAGTVFLDEARAVLARAGAAEEALADLAGLKRGTLQLAASQTVANYWLPQRLCRFRAAYPRIDIGLTIGNTEQVRGWVSEGRAALGFVEGPVADPRLLPERVGEDRLVLVMAPDHPLARMPAVDAAALMSLTFVTREPGSGTRVMLDRLAASVGLALADLQIALELPSNEAVRAAVEAGAGAAVLSRLVADAAIRLGTLAAIELPLAPRPFFLLRHATRRPSHTVRAFMEGIDAPLP